MRGGSQKEAISTAGECGVVRGQFPRLALKRYASAAQSELCFRYPSCIIARNDVLFGSMESVCHGQLVSKLGMNINVSTVVL